MLNFFDIEFTLWNDVPECRSWIDRYFDYYVLDFAETGSLEFRYGDEIFRQLSGPVVWMTFPGPRFQFGHKERQKDAWHHRYVAFRGKFADELVERGVFPVKHPIVQIYNPDRFTTAFDALLNYLDAPARGNDRAVNMLMGVLLQLHEQKIEQRFTRMDGRIKKLIKKIKESPGKDWNFKREADRLNLSFSRFRRIFADSLKQSPGAFLIAERMNSGAKMLKETDMTITEIAETCCYEDIYYFNKSFKKHFGIPPGKYRKQFNL